MKKLTLIPVLFLSCFCQSAEIFGLDTSKPLNKQLAENPFVTWVEGGMKINGIDFGINYLELEVRAFDAKGDTYATGKFTLLSSPTADLDTCKIASQQVKSKFPAATSFNKYFGKDEYGCDSNLEGGYYFFFGGQLK